MSVHFDQRKFSGSTKPGNASSKIAQFEQRPQRPITELKQIVSELAELYRPGAGERVRAALAQHGPKVVMAELAFLAFVKEEGLALLSARTAGLSPAQFQECLQLFSQRFRNISVQQLAAKVEEFAETADFKGLQKPLASAVVNYKSWERELALSFEKIALAVPAVAFRDTPPATVTVPRNGVETAANLGAVAVAKPLVLVPEAAAARSPEIVQAAKAAVIAVVNEAVQLLVKVAQGQPITLEAARSATAMTIEEAASVARLAFHKGSLIDAARDLGINFNKVGDHIFSLATKRSLSGKLASQIGILYSKEIEAESEIPNWTVDVWRSKYQVSLHGGGPASPSSRPRVVLPALRSVATPQAGNSPSPAVVRSNPPATVAASEEPSATKTITAAHLEMLAAKLVESRRVLVGLKSLFGPKPITADDLVPLNAAREALFWQVALNGEGALPSMLQRVDKNCGFVERGIAEFERVQRVEFGALFAAARRKQMPVLFDARCVLPQQIEINDVVGLLLTSAAQFYKSKASSNIDIAAAAATLKIAPAEFSRMLVDARDEYFDDEYRDRTRWISEL